MGHTVGQNGVDARIQQQDLQITARGGVALAHGGDVSGDLLADGGDGVIDLLCRLLAKAREIKIDDIIILAAHDGTSQGMEWECEERRLNGGSSWTEYE